MTGARPRAGELLHRIAWRLVKTADLVREIAAALG